ncbi:MAG: ABC transporter permease [Gemmatimonadota bacterium]|nr:ABC transporter permease [Gemmatimonadota bacterium]
MSSVAGSDFATKPEPQSPMQPAVKAPMIRLIRRRSGWLAIDLAELWRYRGVLAFLIRRDLKVRYAQTLLGAAWAIFQPVAPMLVFTVIFGVLGKMPSDGVPYALFALSGLVAWTYFSSAVLSATTSLIANPELVTKVYFPRLTIPLASLLAALADFGVGLGVLLVLMLARGIVPRLEAIVLVPLLVVLMVSAASGVGFWLSALGARYRDVKHVTPVLLQLMMFASPIVYPVSLLPEKYRALYSLNPMVGIVDGLRAALFGTRIVEPRSILISVAVSAVLLVSGALYFRRTERLFADFV